jgi:hypothetical protein
MNDPAGKYQLVENLISSPGHCWISKVSEGQFIDTGMSILFNEKGRLYISVSELKEMANVAGLFDGLQKKDPNRDNTMRSIGYAEGIKENGSINSTINRLNDSAGRIVSILSSSDVSTSKEQPEDAGVFVTGGSVERSGADKPTEELSVDSGQSGSSSGNKRSSRFPADTSNANPFRI